MSCTILGVMASKSKIQLPPLDLGNETVGERIARLRKERGLTQVELAKKIGIGQTLITDYERGKLRLHAEMVIRFAIALDVRTDELLGINNSVKDDYSPSLKVVKRWKKIEALPKSKQRALFETIDNFIKGAKI